MTAIRIVIAAAALVLALGACSRDEEPAAGAGNALLDYVPADTPYLAANLEPLPEDVVDAYLLRAQPVLDEMQAQLSKARTDLEGQDPAGVDDPGERLALALLRELDGKLSREGLNSLGLDIGSHKVVYGLGAFPVLRVGLSNAVSMQATIHRVLDGAGLTAPEQSLQGVAYWRVGPDAHHDMPVGLYLAILEDHLAIGILPAAAEAETLPAFLGLERPAQSDARTRLAELNRAHGYTAHGSAILDLRLLADQFLQADSLTARVLVGAGAYDPATITPECVAEVHGIIDNAPRVTAGTTELSTTAIAYQNRVETPATLAGELIKLAARIPAADALSTRVLDLAFGIRFGAVRDFLREKANAVAQNPYRCEFLSALNSHAEQALAQLEQPMPPFVNNFQGLRVSLDEIAVSDGGLPAGARGHLALHVEQPEMFLGMAQMFLPDLAALGLKAGEPPLRLPETLLPVPGLVAFAAMTGEAIGLSLGDGEEAGLAAYLDRDAGPEGMFLSLSYDSAAYLEYTDRLTGSVTDDTSGAGADAHAAHAVEAVATAARQVLRDTADRSHTTLRFAPDGLVIDGRMTFKP
ncbi:MAG: hypothetical protein MUE63_10345 [Xanthomonadales bacterium]|nr:hypothetical protein [Xanthomonadales bacterium]